MTWLVATYEPTALFSLKDSQATSAAGKSLLVPSPYAVKTALIDVAVNWQGVAFAQEVFGWLRGMQVRSSPPQWACVTNSFVKVQRPPKKAEPGNPFKPTVAFREYVQFRGELRLAFEVFGLTADQRQTLSELLLRLNMLGKRGGFMQWLEQSEMPDLDAYFVAHAGDGRMAGGSAVMHYLDDYGPKMTWEKLSTFDKATPDRVVVSALVPYRMRRSSKRSMVYERVG